MSMHPRAGHTQMVQIAGVPFAATQVITRVTPAGTTRTEGRIARNSAGSTYVEEIDPANGSLRRVLILDVPGKRLITLDMVQHRYAVQTAPALRSRAVPVGWVGDELRWAEEHRNVSASEATGDSSWTQTWLGTRQVSGLLTVGTVREQRPAGGSAESVAGPVCQIDESWFSVELGMSVLMTERRPRTGATTQVILTAILRVEPSASLFAVPPDFAPESGAPPPQAAPSGGPASDGL